MTQDHGKTWVDVTIPKLPNPTRADISAIEASHSDPATAYVAIDYHTTGDYAPYFYRTQDFGQSWTKIVSGLPADQPSGSFARVIRCDTKRPGLLFAGTESSVYVSFDNGDNWQSLVLNLPNTSYRDMVVKDNDLVVGTYGRGFWVLDDLSPLRQIAASMTAEPAHLFKPGDALRVRRNTNGDTPFPPGIPHALNPPLGAIIYYYLGAPTTGDIMLDVRDSAGKLVRHMSSAAMPTVSEAAPPVPDFWVEKPKPLPKELGTNRINWNLRYDNPPAFNHTYEINANPGETPASPEGPLVLPGVYSVTLTVNGKAYTENVTVKNDPRSPADSGALKAQHLLQMEVYKGAFASMEGYRRAAALRDAVDELVGEEAPEALAQAADAFKQKITAVGGSAGGGRRGFGGGGGFGAAGGPPPAPTFARVNGQYVRQINSLDPGDMAPNEPTLNACKLAAKDLKTAEAVWKLLLEKDLPAFNAVLVKSNLKPIPVPTSKP